MIAASQCPDQETLNRLRNASDVGSSRWLQWPDVVVNTAYRELEKEVLESSFTIFSVNTDGLVTVSLKNRDVRFCRETLCVINPYERFSFSLKASQPVQLTNVHLSIDTYRQMLSNILLSDEVQLEQPDDTQRDYSFGNHLFFNEPAFRRQLLSLKDDDHDGYLAGLTNMLRRLIEKNQKSALRIPSARPATRAELFRRVAIGRDIIFSRYNDPGLTVDSLSRDVSMSRFHFLRVFKQAYGYTPHKLIQQVRVKKALEFLKAGQLSVTDIAEEVGFAEANSLYPLIRGLRAAYN